MKHNVFWKNIISFLLALSMIITIGAVTAFAEPEDGAAPQEAVDVETPQDTAQETPQGDQQPQETPQDNQQADPQETPQETPQDNVQETPQETPQDGQQETPQDNQQEAPQEQNENNSRNEWYDYIYNYGDAISSYVEPEHLGELPEVKSGQVQEATAVPMPSVAVSESSLFSGIVMWLCVALGIAVVVGVLVSKRTRRRGA